MNTILNHISVLYDHELYSNIVKIVELVTSQFDQKQELSDYAKFQLYVYYADSLFYTEQYAAAEIAYTQALQIRKYVTKNKSSLLKSVDNQNDNPSDVDIKYKLHLCCIKLKQCQKAIEVLQSISPRTRTAKIHMAMGNLFCESGMERSAIACYKDVLRENPLALDAAENLLRLGVKGAEVNSMLLEATTDLSWINTWLRGQAELHSHDYSSAAATFRVLETQGPLKDNAVLLVQTANCYNLVGDEKKSLACLQRAIRFDNNLKGGRDLLASLLATSSDREHLRDLERLVNTNTDMTLWSCEQWIAMGYYMYALNRYDRAIYFGQQACTMNRHNVEALLLKAMALMQINKYQEAALHCREALQCSPFRFEAHKYLVDCYIGMNRLREAITVARNACKQLNRNTRSLTLYASVLTKDPLTTCKVRTVLEKAIASDPTYSPAVYLLAEQLIHEKLYGDAYTVLIRLSQFCATSKLHQMAADCLVRLQKEDEAFEHYSTAVRLDPNNQRALEGLGSIGQSLAANKADGNYYMSIGGESSSYTSQAPSTPDQEQEPESDSDRWPNNSPDLITFE